MNKKICVSIIITLIMIVTLATSVLAANEDVTLVKVKDNIYVVGSPIENEYFATVTSGIISYNNRKIKVETSNGSVLVNTIQIDAKINYGNSGSPLLNEKNEVIGMVFVKEEELDGIGFAIPINKIKEVIK